MGLIATSNTNAAPKRKLARILIAFALLTAACSAQGALPSVKDGDIIFQTSLSAQSVAIQRATGSRYSHVGLVVHRNGEPYVFEAVATVRFTPLGQWVSRGSGRHFVVKRLRDAGTILTPSGLGKLRAAASRFAGRPYDLTFGWSDDRIYCSELVWKAYDRGLGIQVGRVQKIRDFNLSDPAVHTKMRERYGDHIPLDEPVISPVAIFQSPLLVTVAEQ